MAVSTDRNSIRMKPTDKVVGATKRGELYIRLPKLVTCRGHDDKDHAVGACTVSSVKHNYKTALLKLGRYFKGFCARIIE